MNNIHSKKIVFLFILLFLSPIFGGQLAEKIDQIVHSSHCHTGVIVYSLKENRVVYEKNADKLFTPASNVKLFLAAAALNTLTAHYRFQTILATDGTVEKGVLAGNLFLKGSGDPSLTISDLALLIKKLSEKGVQEVTGHLYIDFTDFDTTAFAPGTTVDDVGEVWDPAIGALMCERRASLVNPINTVEFLDVNMQGKIYNDMAVILTELCAQNNIALKGQIVSGKMAEGVQFLEVHCSEPLALLLKRCLKNSDNLYADCLFKTIGAKAGQVQGSWTAGKNAIKCFLEAYLSIHPEELKIVDGSGLSRYDLVSPRHLLHLLLWVLETEHRDLFIDLLPISGVDGTLKYRMSECEGRVKAKTGTMGGVSALSGYILKADDTLVFSIINNGYITLEGQGIWCKTHVEDAICTLLCEI